MDFDRDQLLNIFDAIKQKRNTQSEYIDMVQRLDKEIQFDILEYRIASVVRILEYIKYTTDNDFDGLITHCINKLNGNIDGTELDLKEN